ELQLRLRQAARLEAHLPDARVRAGRVLVLEPARRRRRAEESPAAAGRHAERRAHAGRIVDAELVAVRLRRVAPVAEQRGAALPAELQLVAQVVRVVLHRERRLRSAEAIARRLAGADAALLRIARVLRADVPILAIERLDEDARAGAVALVGRAEV